MSILDFLRSKRVGGSTSDPISLDDALSMITKEVERRESSVYPSCARISESILSEADAARKAAAVVGEGALDNQNIHYQIGLQMQRNFADRVPAVLGSLAKPEKGYQSYVRFHAASLQAVKDIAKISSDNRYLPIFLGSEVGAFGKRMNTIVKLTDQLGSEIGSVKGSADLLMRTQTLKGGVSQLKAELSVCTELESDIARQKESLEREIASAAETNRRLEQEEGVARQRMQEAGGLVSADRRGLSERISPFQRQFRKLQKVVLEKDIAAALESYIDDPAGAVIEEVRQSKDYPLLRKALLSMRAALEKGGLEADEKIRSRRLDSISDILGGSLLRFAERAIEQEAALVKEQASLDGILRRKHGTDDMRIRLEHLSEQVIKVETERKQHLKDIESAVVEIEGIAKNVTGKEIRIGRRAPH